MPVNKKIWLRMSPGLQQGTRISNCTALLVCAWRIILIQVLQKHVTRCRHPVHLVSVDVVEMQLPCCHHKGRCEASGRLVAILCCDRYLPVLAPECTGEVPCRVLLGLCWSCGHEQQRREELQLRCSGFTVATGDLPAKLNCRTGFTKGG
jgi:hypothetical protein